MIWVSLGAIAVFYLTVLIALFVFQRQIIFQPTSDARTPADIRLHGYRIIPLITNDQVSIHGWFHPPRDGEKTVVFFHGNAGTLAIRQSLLEPLADAGFGVMALEYRGYAGLPGSPTEQGLYEDARTALDYLIAREQIAPQELILLGRSLGSGVAVQMATEYDIHRLVLIAPFTSVPDVAQEKYRIFPARPLVLDRFDNRSKLEAINSPILIFHGSQDWIIPYHMSQELQAMRPDMVELITMDGQGHNNLNEDRMVNIMAQRLLRGTN